MNQGDTDQDHVPKKRSKKTGTRSKMERLRTHSISKAFLAIPFWNAFQFFWNVFFFLKKGHSLFWNTFLSVFLWTFLTRQYFEKNNRKNYKIIAKMFQRHFCLAIEIYQYNSYSFYRALRRRIFKKNSRYYHFLKLRNMQNTIIFQTFLFC